MQNHSGKTDNYIPASLPTVLDIHAIYSVHYFEYAKNFSFAGEMHDFWEFIYVDRGEVFITADDREILLQKDEIAFHKPMEFHAVHAKNFTPNLIVISFMCTSPAHGLFQGPDSFRERGGTRHSGGDRLPGTKMPILPDGRPVSEQTDFSSGCQSRNAAADRFGPDLFSSASDDPQQVRGANEQSTLSRFPHD